MYRKIKSEPIFVFGRYLNGSDVNVTSLKCEQIASHVFSKDCGLRIFHRTIICMLLTLKISVQNKFCM